MKIDQNIEINIKNLVVKAIIGVFEEEKLNPQTLLIDLKIKFDAAKSMQSDNLEDTIDYFKLSQLIKEKVESSKFKLLEKLLDFILEEVMKIKLANEATLTIHKPQALSQFGAVVSVSASAKKAS